MVGPGYETELKLNDGTGSVGSAFRQVSKSHEFESSRKRAFNSFL